jgi:protoporphyrinogen/coproporphyrinogen III oxidase
MTPHSGGHGSFRPRVAIIGGGIAGLATAHAVRALAPEADVVVLEARDRVGGNIRSERVAGYLCENGPDGFLDNAPATLAFIDAVGLSSRILPSRDEARRRFIFRRDRLHEVPISPGAFAFTPLLSIAAKLRVLAEPFAARSWRHDESILGFAERHIGREAARVLVGSIVSGIFAGDASELSLRSCFPKMHDMEQQYGSLFRALLAKRRTGRSANGVGAPAGRLTSFAAGMQELVDAAASALGPVVRTGCSVTAIQVRLRGPDPRPRLVGARAYSLACQGRRIETDAVVLAGPASEAANLLLPFAPAAAAPLAAIQTAPLAVVCLGYDEAALVADRGPLNGFGFLVPHGDGPRILGALWESSIYDGRAPIGKALIRVMMGGATDPGAVGLSDRDLVGHVRMDLERTMGIRVTPEFVHIVRHARGIPQYTVGHAARLERIEGVLAGFPGLFLAGNSYRGVSVNACIEDASPLALRVVEHLQTVGRADDYAVAL